MGLGRVRRPRVGEGLLGPPLVDVHLRVLLSPGLDGVGVDVLLFEVSNLVDVLLAVLDGVAHLRDHILALLLEHVLLGLQEALQVVQVVAGLLLARLEDTRGVFFVGRTMGELFNRERGLLIEGRLRSGVVAAVHRERFQNSREGVSTLDTLRSDIKAGEFGRGGGELAWSIGGVDVTFPIVLLESLERAEVGFHR